MRLPTLVLRNLRRRPLATALTSLSVALGVGLFSMVGAVRDASEQAFQRSAGICDLLVGAKGSTLELTLNALYHMGNSPGNVPYALYQEVRDTPGVEWCVPQLVGDSYQGHRIVGVTDPLFDQLQVPGHGRLTFRAGGGFQHSGAELDAFHLEAEHHAAEEAGGSQEAAPADGHDHELEELAQEKGWFVAVLGAEAARSTGLKVGDHFLPAHEVTTNGKAHEDAETEVVGVLEPTGTPIDRAIYIPAAAYYAIQGHQATEDTTFGGTRDPLGVSTLLVRTKPGISGIYRINLWRGLNDRLDAQAVYPGSEVRKLFAVIGNVDAALRLVSLLVVVVALVGVLVALYNTMGARRREFAVLRALGARRSTILGLVMAESTAIALIGGLLGMVLAGVGASVAGGRIAAMTGVTISPLPDMQDWMVLAAVAVVGALAGLVPALQAYRTEAARTLSSNL